MTTNNTPALRQFRNTDERFGDVGPFEAVSAEALADEMMPTLRAWAAEQSRDAATLRAEFLAGLEEVTTISLLDLCRARVMAGESLIHNDRGNGCGGPMADDATAVLNAIERDEEREDEDLTLVTESEDPEAWELAREAFRAFDIDPATVRAVAIGERASRGEFEDPAGYQAVYCW